MYAVIKGFVCGVVSCVVVISAGLSNIYNK